MAAGTPLSVLSHGLFTEAGGGCDYPDVSDVREGVIYSFGLLTGILAVGGAPTPDAEFHDAADIVRWFLVSQSILSNPELDPQEAWPAYHGVMQDKPDKAVMVETTTGILSARAMPDGTRVEHNGVQIMIRAVDPRTAFNKAKRIVTALNEEITEQIVQIGTKDYFVTAATLTTDIVKIGKETPNSKRVLYSINCIINYYQIVDIAAPTILAMSVVDGVEGSRLSVTFSEEIVGSAGITLDATLGPVTVTSIHSGSGTPNVVFNLSRNIGSTETVTAAYTPGDLGDFAGNALEAISGIDVTNASTLSPVPQLIGLQAWYDATQEAPVADGTAVQPLDFSGNNRHQLQATSTKRPLYKVGVQAGLPVFRYDGVDDLTRVVFALTQPNTVFAVVKQRATLAGLNQFFIDGANEGGMAILAIPPATTWGITAGAFFSSGFSAGVVNFHRLAAIFNGASSSIRIDANAPVSGNAGAGAPGGVALGSGGGGSAPAQFDIAEVVVASGVKSTAEIDCILLYLKNKWGLL